MAKTILVVDDDPGVTYTVKNGLETLDTEYNVISIESGEKCLDFLEHNQLPDIILLDIMMPGMSGWETYNQIKDNLQWKEIHIVFLTQRKDNVAKHAGEFLAEDYIEKPFEISELKQRLDHILQKT
jgi:CheY-like chemotaxis protein